MKDLDIKALINQQTIPLAKNLTTGEYEAIIVSPDTLRAFELGIDISATDNAGNRAKTRTVVQVDSIWIPPKTNWDKDDFFNVEDWRRIMGNLVFIYDLSIKMYPYYEIKEMPGIRVYDDFPRADDFNLVVSNLENVIKHTYMFKHPSIRLFVDNGNFVDYIELNQIEQVLLQAYQYLSSQYENIRVLPFTLGGDEFGN